MSNQGRYGRIAVTSDDSTVFITAASTATGHLNICKWVVVTTGVHNIDCMPFGGLTYIGSYNMLSDNLMFFIYKHETDDHAYFRRLDFDNPSSNGWAYKMNCPDTDACSVEKSYSVLSTDSTKLYTMVGIGGATHGKRNVFSILNSSTGALIGNVFESTECTAGTVEVFHMISTSSKVYILTTCTNNNLMVFDISSNSFTGIYQFTTGTFVTFAEGISQSE